MDHDFFQDYVIDRKTKKINRLRDIKNLEKLKHEVYIYLKNPDLYIKIFLNIDNQTSIYKKGTVNKGFKDSYKFMYIIRFRISQFNFW